MNKRHLEHLYWQRNQDPKVYQLLDDSQKETPRGLKEGWKGEQERALGKHSSIDKFIIKNPKDMIPIVYPKTMNDSNRKATKKIKPVIYKLNKEHEEILKMQANNPGAKLEDLADKYYEKKDKHAKDSFRKRIMSQTTHNHKDDTNIPTVKVKNRMYSEHLNTWMKHGEIQEVAERYEEFKEMTKLR